MKEWLLVLFLANGGVGLLSAPNGPACFAEVQRMATDVVVPFELENGQTTYVVGAMCAAPLVVAEANGGRP